MSEVKVIPQRNVYASLKNIPAYDGVTYAISVPTSEDTQVNLLVVGPDSQSVADAIHTAWPDQPVDQRKMSRVIVMSGKEIEDEEL